MPAHAVADNAAYAYVAWNADGVRVLDLSGGGRPTEVGFYVPADTADDRDAATRRARDGRRARRPQHRRHGRELGPVRTRVPAVGGHRGRPPARHAGPDRIDGLAGNDRIRGFDGADSLIGGPGVDDLTGGAGSDRLLGGDGGDVMGGERGNDRLAGGAGNDRLGAARRTTRSPAGPGATYLAGPGNDVVDAANGVRETLNCGPGRDRAVADRRDVARQCERIVRRR